MNSENRLIFERYTQSIHEETLGGGEMNVAQLKEYLEGIKGATPVFVEVEAPVKMLVKSRETGEPNPFIGTVKRSTIEGMAGGDYELGVMNRELNAHADQPDYQPQFQAASLWHWKGIRVSPLLVKHTDTNEYYLVVGDVKEGTGEYLYNGQPIPRDQIAAYINKPAAPSAKQAAVGIAPENQKNVRYPMLRNIKKLRINRFEINVV